MRQAGASVVDEAQIEAALNLRRLLAIWADNEELVRLGAYRKGSSAEVDEAIDKRPLLTTLLQQKVTEPTPLKDTVNAMQHIAAWEGSG